MRDTELIQHIARMPLRTTRWQDVDDVEVNAARKLKRLEGIGAVTRIAKGVYTVPPNGADGRRWKAPLEAAALALATVRFGERQAVLMGPSAARHWGAIPRALGVAQVAVNGATSRPMRLIDGTAVTFVVRDLTRLDTTVERTALGDALVTTPAQTFYDLLARGRHNGDAEATQEAITNLTHRVTPDEIAAIADRHLRVAPAIRDFIRTGAL